MTRESDFSVPNFETFAMLPHAITLLGMSGVGKTHFSTRLRWASKQHRDSANWFHFSADYRIGTAYLAEHILDNIKAKIMDMEDRFVASLLRSDSIYVSHNISVDNLEAVTSFLGMYGDPKRQGLDKETFRRRQRQYRDAEIAAMKDVGRFIEKSRRIYECEHFVNDASGSLCEIVDPENAEDPVIEALRRDTLILYLRADDSHEAELKARAEEDPKPLYYNHEFITPYLERDDAVDPKAFAIDLFPKLVEFRKPRYQKIADNFGFTIDVGDLPSPEEDRDKESMLEDYSDRFLRKIHELLVTAVARPGVAAENAGIYMRACRDRARERV